MINKIVLENIASFKDLVEMEPKKINYIYGSNGSGKTTISRILSGKITKNSCSYNTSGDSEIVVYNKDFVDENFSETIKGIFTLGEESTEIRKEVEEKRIEQSKLRDEIVSKNKQIESKKIEKEKLKENIEEKYKTVFSKENVLYNEIEEIKNDDVKLLYEDSIMEKRIVGSKDSQIGELIEFLNNSDWVRKSQDYLEKSNDTCPFCQQELPNNFKKQLLDYFDLDNIFDNKDRLLINLNKNNELIKEKIGNPSKTINLIDIKKNIESLNIEIEMLNKKIKKNNKEVENETQEKEKCKEMIWDNICNNASVQIQQFKKQNRGLDKAIKSIVDQLENTKEGYNNIEKEIISKELKLTSVKPTVVKINKIIKQFGFNNFEIAENKEEKGTYKIIRPDGNNAKKTLSEGEYRFITFLYFYNFIYGSKKSTGIGKNKVIVIDDPISSLDSNVLFIVNTLVKNLITDCNKDKNGIKQVIILTHNIYFYKEVTFLGAGKNPSSQMAYWILKKNKKATEIVLYKKCPIKSSYELLWEEVRTPKDLPNSTVFNTLRRILEYYFKIIGGVDYEKYINDFKGKEKHVCKSLISFINDQSHDVYDDLFVCLDTQDIEIYLEIFKKIFYNNNQSQHYDMMMKIKN